jgi:hypothetical protein
MIDVRVGTTAALEVREDINGNQVVMPVEGERTISFLMPDGVSSMDASAQVIGALNGMMMEAGATPWWIESSDQAVAVNLLSHYGVEQSQMPERWGDGSTSGSEPLGTLAQRAAAPPPDAQGESTPMLAEAEAMAEPEVVAQSTTTKTTRRRKVAAEPAPEPAPEPEPEMTQPEAQPEETP